MDRFSKFQKVDKDSYGSINKFLKDRSLLTTREWMISEAILEFREEETGRVPMTEAGEKLPQLFPFIDKEYSASDFSNAKSAFEDKVIRAGSTFFYALEKGYFTEDKLKEVIIEISKNIREINDIADDEIEEEFIDILPEDIKKILKELREFERDKERDKEIREPLFGDYLDGEIGDKWIEKVETKIGEFKIEFKFERNLSPDDILVPSELEDKKKYLDIDKEYAYLKTGNLVKRYKIEIID
ncbi:MAG: hypothetical protein BTN85_1388 [Candidatus Methanohalarchaeum thermophilum]|uniref:Uncharacterized protein n=1 Tax=Methanohalarchaeum thermophilum TaxID=1903181 RepID=A0A1Q6DWZ4_METT1|nr:MAG: hypothetical protein BTN85_1388 [Candidatus Methanohalarchaeum thermophilum]